MDNNVLVHYGVKGMKWGVRRQLKKQEKERLRNMTNDGLASFDDDAYDYGKRSAYRIRKRIEKGVSVEDSYRKANRESVLKGLAIIGAMSATAYMAKHPEKVTAGANAVKKLLSGSKGNVSVSDYIGGKSVVSYMDKNVITDSIRRIRG